MVELTSGLRDKFSKVVVGFGEKGLVAFCGIDDEPCLRVSGGEHDFSIETRPGGGMRVLALLSAKAPSCDGCINNKKKMGNDVK